MKPQTSPQLPPALRKARPQKEISDAFPPIVPKPRSTTLTSDGSTLAETNLVSPPAPKSPPVVEPSPTPCPVESALPSSAPALTPPPVSTESSRAPSPAPSTLLPTSAKPSLPAPLVRPVGPSKPLPTVKPSIDAAIAAPKTRPKPVFTGRPPVAQLEGKVVMFEGTFRSEENESFTTETKLTGNPKNDKQSIINLARKKYPTGRMELKSTRIFSREVGPVTTFGAGTTLGQLFGAAGTDTEAAVEIGTVFFEGARCQIFLRNLRSRNCVVFSLRQPLGAGINFSNQIQANRLAKELPYIAREVLGNNVRELKITLKEEAKSV